MSTRSVLIAADSWFGSTTYGIAQGFRQLGWDVYEVSPTRYLPDYSSKFLRVFKRLIKPFAVAEYNQQIIKTARVLKPDLFLTVKGAFLQHETLISLENLNIPTVNYYPDARFHKGVVDETVFLLFSHFFTTKSFQLNYLEEYLGREKVSFLHHGYIGDVHQPRLLNAANTEYSCDLLHIGTYNAEKQAWLSAVKQRFPDQKLLIYGEGWQQRAQGTALSQSVVGQAVYGSAYARAIQSAKINLAVHMGAADQSGWQDLVSTRTFEIPACKGFILHIDNSEVRELFKPDEEIGVFSDIDSLSERIEHYLNDENHRLSCIENAYRRCVPSYSYEARAKVIIDWFESYSGA